MKKIILFHLLFLSTIGAQSHDYTNTYDQRMGIFPNFCTYEKLTNSSIYYCFEGFYNVIGSRCAQIETRLGYNMMCNDNDYLCPYLSAGWLKGYKNDNLFKKANIFFGALGLAYDHEILSIFHIGFRSELLLGSKIKDSKNNLIYGFEGRIPITFYFGEKRKFDFRLEPFAIFLNEKTHSSDLWGLLFNLGYKY